MKKSILASVIPMSLSGAFSAQKNSDILFSNNIGEHFKNRHSSNICFAEGDEGGDGDNTPADIDFNDPRIKDYVQQQVSENVTSLKTKNTELLGKLQSRETKLEGYGDMSPEQVKQILNVIQGTDEAQLIADGKIDEVIQKRMDREKAVHSDELTNLNEQLTQLSDSSNKYKALYENKVIGDDLRAEAIKQGVRPEAYDDILRRGSDIFSLAEDGSIEARDKDGILIKDSKGMLVTPARFLEELKASAPYYWPESQSGNLDSQRNNRRQSNENEVSKLNDVVGTDGKFDLEAYRKARGDNKERYSR